MNTILSFTLCSFLIAGTIGLAHTGEVHIQEMKSVMNGFGDSKDFQKLAEIITKSIDNTVLDSEAPVQGFPAKFKEMMGTLPGNHRLLAHKWVVGEAIPKETLDMLDKYYPKKRGEIIGLWRDHTKQVIEITQELSGLSPKKAKAMASLLSSIHLLGDIEPGNTMIDDVLPLDDIAKNIKRNLVDLGGYENPLIQSIETKIDKVIRSGKQGKAAKIAKLISSGECATAAEAERVLTQRMARELMDVLHTSEIGPAIKQGCPRISLNFSEKALSKAANSTKRRMIDRIPRIAGKGYEGEARLTQQAFGKGTPYAREVMQASGKKLTTNVAGQTVVAAGLISNDGRIFIPTLHTGGIEGGAVFLFDAGIAGYQYVSGDITRPEMVREVEDAAIKGSTVGGAAAVAVLLGATPAGWVVIGVGIGTYFVTDIALGYYHKYNDSKYLNDDDLKAFGINENSLLDFNEIDSPLDSW